MSNYHAIRREPPHAQTAVLLLHGILSAPQYFDFIMPEIPAEAAVYGILFEGHGGQISGIAQASMDHWKSQVHEAMQALSSRYRNIIIIAHSMGTLLAVQTAREFPARLRRMILLDIPMYVHLTPDGFAHFTATGLGLEIAQDARAQAVHEAYSLEPDSHVLRYAAWLPRYAELFREIVRTRRMMNEIRVPCDIFQSRHDELVSMRSVRCFLGNPNLRVRVLHKSGHFYYADDDRKTILRAVRRCMAHYVQTGKSPETIPKRSVSAMKFYQNPQTGEFAAEECPGFAEIIPNTVDAAKEKHVPVISREGQTVTVTVGEVAHPMLDNHYIGWIVLETKNGQERKELNPGEEPVAQFYVAEDDSLIAAYAYCNLHGLWKAEA